jgi:hypothetical protein
LVNYTDEQSGREDTHPFGPDPQGFLIYAVDGFVSAQLMRTGRPAFHSSDWHHGTPQEYQDSGSGYIAYCGTFEVGEENATVTHIPSVSLLPNLIGGRQCQSISKAIGLHYEQPEPPSQVVFTSRAVWSGRELLREPHRPWQQPDRPAEISEAEPAATKPRRDMEEDTGSSSKDTQPRSKNFCEVV